VSLLVGKAVLAAIRELVIPNRKTIIVEAQELRQNEVGNVRIGCKGKRLRCGIVRKAVLERLMKIPGIGKWTAQYVAMRALGEPDAFPTGDAALLSALNLESSAELELRAEAWRPWRAYATMYLWNSLGQGRVHGTKRTLSKARKGMVETTAQHVSIRSAQSASCNLTYALARSRIPSQIA